MCYKCQIRSYFGDGPCDQCKIKSASIKIAEVEKEPYYVTLAKYYGGLEL